MYSLAEVIADTPREHGGRPRHYPRFMTIVWLALISVYRSSRQVDAELSDKATWSRIQRLVKERFPDDADLWLRDTPMRRHHYLHARKALIDPVTQRALVDEFERAAAELALSRGLCDPGGDGSLTHPSLERTLYGDGKVVTPHYKAKPGDCKVQKETGEVRRLRADPDAELHITGSGEPAYGNKYVLWEVRDRDAHERVILGIEAVPNKGGEAAIALDVLSRIAPNVPGVQAILYDGAFRGVHNQAILKKLGLVPVVPVQAASGGRRSGKPRVEHEGRLGEGVIHRPDGTATTCQFYTVAGAPHIGELDEAGHVALIALERNKTIRRPNTEGTYRWYGEYNVAASSGGGTVRLRLDITDDDRRRKYNRTEHLRPIPPSDPDFGPLYARRADAESINRGLNDSLYLTRAHSVGQARQLCDLLGFGIMVNALARTRPAKRLREQAA